eukprot:scaffold6959_cov146-Isochrysis_galbana.AAC.1
MAPNLGDSPSAESAEPAAHSRLVSPAGASLLADLRLQRRTAPLEKCVLLLCKDNGVVRLSRMLADILSPVLRAVVSGPLAQESKSEYSLMDHSDATVEFALDYCCGDDARKVRALGTEPGLLCGCATPGAGGRQNAHHLWMLSLALYVAVRRAVPRTAACARPARLPDPLLSDATAHPHSQIDSQNALALLARPSPLRRHRPSPLADRLAECPGAARDRRRAVLGTASRGMLRVAHRVPDDHQCSPAARGRRAVQRARAICGRALHHHGRVQRPGRPHRAEAGPPNPS